MGKIYDFIVIGAGPSGSVFAALASKKYSVLLADRRDLSVPHKDSGYGKACGGLIAPDAQKVISRLGLGVPADVLSDPQLFAVNTIDAGSGLHRLYQRHYINIDREKFDRWLAGRVSGADLIFGCVFRNFQKAGGLYEVEISRKGKSSVYRARNIVSAEGASSLVRRKLYGPYPPGAVYVSIQDKIKIKKYQPYFYAVFDSRVTDFYSWVIPKDGYLYAGSALKPGNDAASKFEIFKSGLREYGLNVDGKFERSGALIIRPSESSVLRAGEDGIALTGEAGGWISPSSAEGFSYAFNSSIALYDSIADSYEGFIDRYNKNLSSLKMNIMLKNLKSPFMYNRLLRNAILKSGVNSLKEVIPGS